MSYPKLVIDRQTMRDNIKNIIDTCEKSGVEVVAVVKGVNGLPGIMEVVMEAGAKTIASSRLSQLRKAKEMNPHIKTYALRIPMLSEIEELVESADISLNSELEVLEKIDAVCKAKGITHDVIIMCELGDLREGIYDQKELLEVVKEVEEDLTSLNLLGIGTNLGCYGSIMPTVEKMNELIALADLVSETIGRKIEVVSGGASTSYPLVGRGETPEGITQLRIGDGLYINDLDECFNFETLEKEALTLQAEIVELRDKPSHPIGEIAVNAFGDKVEYEDKGIRKRALIAVGKQDIGDYGHLRPLDEKIDVIGGSSDHTIIDVTDSDREYKLGDIMEFHLMYETMLMTTQSEYVEKEYI
ncbi:alanine racemase [Allofustis seminis]|uniref:alanine racemase n=1 Tax=Allofustis seminis TaxID=166939 RepID=UPI0003811749|nr:alanine racemase [Allofustis seminis]